MLCSSSPPPSPTGSEISVGSPSPPPRQHGEDYFRPLKRLKGVQARERSASPSRSSLDGVKSFSIADILGHEPQNQLIQQTKIVRPWDHLRGPVPVRPFLPPALFHYEHRLALDYQRQLQEHLTAQAQLLRHMSMDIIPSESGSERSSSAASDCCSPEISNNRSSEHHQQINGQKTKPNGTPLDALFQMTNKNFDETQNENSSGEFAYFNLIKNVVFLAHDSNETSRC